ncbi:sigma-70 family rna polymerase sigma factor : Uncultured bacterium genome assembly Metasoil_fosmids_resub OS=uncultured bacterium PE=4 SV=1: Sigma70_r2: Sigma70_r4_2: F5_F8_type_C [Gemmata massiliana]|uniref:F5/8 type C domain-containing protein n=1 Tax=Gemmata massiliana TaxID=1210884 RepID=A0A6P2CYK8_9BACT|nr:sigma-70 family RNA polymerase sigma factor [Gemmata massiliana]VTR92290.1 sigma-70 family rna polymerase sigma factor : Uncultured bacterium genome assembly Metasoil_fosmids_resub OS=uncultured bacterium PE=4 SV=1: Sigma70_r2: Sigma70_r4_2: F5_F8_type_C [Gemmata massiliana]
MTIRAARLLDHLNRLTTSVDLETLSDSALLTRFARQHDHSAFTTLVARHGSMVYNVCYRRLGNVHAAEDAFQAAFLVLARKAGSLRCHSLTAWLHGVAVRVALNARRAIQRCPVRETLTATGEIPGAHTDPLFRLSVHELLQALEEEVQRLPRAYRLAVVLCCLEGLSQEEAAHRLGWTVGSVKGRLERGRTRLRELLARRGLVPAVVATVLQATRNELSAALTVRAVKVALASRELESPHQAVVSGEVLRLAQHTLKGMSMFKWKLAVALALFLGVTTFGAFAQRDGQDKEAADKKSPPMMVTVDLNDGSRVVGKSDALKELLLRVSFGEVRIPVEQVASMQFKDDQGGTVVRFHNGDQLTGTLDLKALGDLKIVTALGETKVPLKLVTACKLEAAPGRAKVTARASSIGEGTDPNNPFRHDDDTRWNSGGYAPAWIEADLGAVRTLDRITLVIGQHPKGETEHEIWVSDEPIGDDRTKAKRVHTFRGETDNDQELKFTFAAKSTARYVQIYTTASPSWVDWHNIDLQVR